MKLMHMKNLMMLIMAGLLLFGCKSKTSVQESEDEVVETAKQEKSKFPFVTLSEGGGFTGRYTEYRIYRDGKVEKYNDAAQSFEQVAMLDKKQSNNLFGVLDEMNLENYSYYKPGNMNYQIILPSEPPHMIAWSDTYSPRVDVLKFYKESINLIRQVE